MSEKYSIGLNVRCTRFKVYHTLAPTGGLSYAVLLPDEPISQRMMLVDVPLDCDCTINYIMRVMQAYYARDSCVVRVHNVVKVKKVVKLFYMNKSEFYKHAEQCEDIYF